MWDLKRGETDGLLMKDDDPPDWYKARSERKS